MTLTVPFYWVLIVWLLSVLIYRKSFITLYLRMKYLDKYFLYKDDDNPYEDRERIFKVIDVDSNFIRAHSWRDEKHTLSIGHNNRNTISEAFKTLEEVKLKYPEYFI